MAGTLAAKIGTRWTLVLSGLVRGRGTLVRVQAARDPVHPATRLRASRRASGSRSRRSAGDQPTGSGNFLSRRRWPSARARHKRSGRFPESGRATGLTNCRRVYARGLTNRRNIRYPSKVLLEQVPAYYLHTLVSLELQNQFRTALLEEAAVRNRAAGTPKCFQLLRRKQYVTAWGCPVDRRK